MKIDLTGTVSLGDAYRVDSDEELGSIYIGDADLVAAVNDKRFTKSVTVAVMDDRYEGDLSVELGWGYSEFTPMDPDRLMVGDHDIVAILERLAGQVVRVVIADEPVDLNDKDTE